MQIQIKAGTEARQPATNEQASEWMNKRPKK